MLGPKQQKQAASPDALTGCQLVLVEESGRAVLASVCDLRNRAKSRSRWLWLMKSAAKSALRQGDTRKPYMNIGWGR